MQITEMKVKVSDLCKNYTDDGDGGVFGYDGRLTIRPSFQREFIYKDKQRDAVIETVRKGFPLNVMYWNKVGDDKYEVLDGQQRTISIAQYLNKDFPVKIDGNDKFYHNLTDSEKQQINDYLLTIYVCEGTEEEKLAWFKVINIAGEVLTKQELLNATYTGSWLADAKNYFSKRNCVAGKFADGYIKGNSIRQDYLEKVLNWIADRDGLPSGERYMAIHQHDADANDLWVYFQTVINWAKTMFPNLDKKFMTLAMRTDRQDWGLLYNKYKDKNFNTNELNDKVKELLVDDEVTNMAGIIPYVLSERTKHDEKVLSLRLFDERTKQKKYELQNHKCPLCVKNGNDKEYTYDEMQADHILPWSKGGKTTSDNCQMLCRNCNNDKNND